MQEVTFLQRLFLILHARVVEVHATGLDGLARLGNRLEQACLHTSLGHTVAGCDLGEFPIDLHAVDSGLKRGLIDVRQIAATSEQRAGSFDGLASGFLAMHEAGDLPCEGALRLTRARIGLAFLDKPFDFGLWQEGERLEQVLHLAVGTVEPELVELVGG